MQVDKPAFEFQDSAPTQAFLREECMIAFRQIPTIIREIDGFSFTILAVGIC
ncbi:MAG: hypothetical protein Udaeo2_20690 [Candidatus Udaeobacter sp.]|nr:MAG: hypothetical protein Udaeo2_20690 [Candidatus Udaeobacter sp.]